MKRGRSVGIIDKSHRYINVGPRVLTAAPSQIPTQRGDAEIVH